MCYYISLAIRSDIQDQAIAMLSPNLELQKNINKSFRSLVPNTFSTYYLTTEVCSCELYEKTSHHMYGFRNDVISYFHRLSKITRTVLINIHFFRREIETEILPITSRQKINLSEMHTTHIDQDCLYQLMLYRSLPIKLYQKN